jgi:hypothetical protein
LISQASMTAARPFAGSVQSLKDFSRHSREREDLAILIIILYVRIKK